MVTVSQWQVQREIWPVKSAPARYSASTSSFGLRSTNSLSGKCCGLTIKKSIDQTRTSIEARGQLPAPRYAILPQAQMAQLAQMCLLCRLCTRQNDTAQHTPLRGVLCVSCVQSCAVLVPSPYRMPFLH